jgi:TPR repeat protein
VPADYAESFKWFRLSAEGGYAPAQAKMGLMLLFGWQVRRDVVEAARWYELAARQGDVRAGCRWPSMYARGQGVAKNLVAAYKWMGVAAKAGDAQSVRRVSRALAATDRRRTCRGRGAGRGLATGSLETGGPGTGLSVRRFFCTHPQPARHAQISIRE